MGALDHLDTMLSRVLDKVRHWGRTAVKKLTGSSADEREEGDERKSESSELHGSDVKVSV